MRRRTQFAVAAVVAVVVAAGVVAAEWPDGDEPVDPTTPFPAGASLRARLELGGLPRGWEVRPNRAGGWALVVADALYGDGGAADPLSEPYALVDVFEGGGLPHEPTPERFDCTEALPADLPCVAWQEHPTQAAAVAGRALWPRRMQELADSLDAVPGRIRLTRTVRGLVRLAGGRGEGGTATSFSVRTAHGRWIYLQARPASPGLQLLVRASFVHDDVETLSTMSSILPDGSYAPPRATKVAGRPAHLGFLDAERRALVVEGDPGVVVVQVSDGRFGTERNLIAVAASLRVAGSGS